MEKETKLYFVWVSLGLILRFLETKFLPFTAGQTKKMYTVLILCLRQLLIKHCQPKPKGVSLREWELHKTK